MLELRFPGVSAKPLDALLLVVPDTSYHARAPILVGTNVL